MTTKKTKNKRKVVEDKKRKPVRLGANFGRLGGFLGGSDKMIRSRNAKKK